MDGEDAYRQLAAALRRIAGEHAADRKLIAELQAALDTVLQILVFRGELAPQHLRMIETVRARAELVQREVALAPNVDKYQLESDDVDCAERMHLCHGRCCSFTITLSRQDLEERELRWRIDEPYLLAQGDDGRCVYQARETGFCGNYEHRPATCRTYACREDRRVWIDFENRIPAPMPGELVAIRRNPKLA